MTKTVIPTTATELEEMLGDRDKIQAMLRDEPATFSELVKAYATESAKRDPDQEKQVREQVQAVMTEFFRDNPDKLAEASRRPALARGAGRQASTHYNPEAIGAALDGQYKGVGELLGLIRDERNGEPTAQARLSQVRNNFASSIPAEGGFLIPEEFRAELLTTWAETAIVRGRARVIPMAVNRINFPTLEDHDHTTGAGYHGGIVTYWEGEGATLQGSAPKFGQVTLDSYRHYAYTEIPNDLISDSIISVQGLVETSFPGAMADSEDEAFLFGNGVKKPLGVLHPDNTAAVSVAKETGQPAGSIVWENLIKMYARMLPSALSTAVWVANINTFPELATMALSVGTGGNGVWMNSGVEGPPVSILGRPVIFTEKAETLGTVGDISLLDFSHYIIGDRQQMTAMWSEHFRFNSDSTAYRIIQRLTGKPDLLQPITPRRGSGTLSPFVKLATRG